MYTKAQLNALVRLNAIYDRLLLTEPRFWPDAADMAGGSLWKARQCVADLISLFHREERHAIANGPNQATDSAVPAADAKPTQIFAYA